MPQEYHQPALCRRRLQKSGQIQKDENNRKGKCVGLSVQSFRFMCACTYLCMLSTTEAEALSQTLDSSCPERTAPWAREGTERVEARGFSRLKMEDPNLVCKVHCLVRKPGKPMLKLSSPQAPIPRLHRQKGEFRGSSSPACCKTCTKQRSPDSPWCHKNTRAHTLYVLLQQAAHTVQARRCSLHSTTHPACRSQTRHNQPT